MPTVLLVFEFLGTTELMIIALVALIIFGPRKLPEIGRTVGRSLAEFKRASEDFKRTWEYEVEVERRQAESQIEQEDGVARERLLDEGPVGDPLEVPVSEAPRDDLAARTVSRAASESAHAPSDGGAAAVGSTEAAHRQET